MGVSIVFGGQWGSEGKGKVAHWYALKKNASSVVRVGGINSGHTVIDKLGIAHKFRVLPTVAIEGSVNCILPAGSYFSLDVLKQELDNSGLPHDKLKIHPNAVIMTEDLESTEHTNGIVDQIGSTGSGTGEAVINRARRLGGIKLAKDEPKLKRFISDTTDFLRAEIDNNREVVIEGTQGYGLSLLHSEHYPYVTSRDTSAAAFLSETGLSPFDVKNVIMVLRSYPIRVAGNSGPLPSEISWQDLSQNSGSEDIIEEYTTVTNKLRRVAVFDPTIVKQAIVCNKPNIIVLNHCDYFDASIKDKEFLSDSALNKVAEIESFIGKVQFCGSGAKTIFER